MVIYYILVAVKIIFDGICTEKILRENCYGCINKNLENKFYLHVWTKLDLRVISAETSGLKIDISGTMSDCEDTFVSGSYGDSQSWIRVLRVYYESSSEPEDTEGSSSPTDDAEPSSPVASSVSSASPFVNVSSNDCTIV